MGADDSEIPTREVVQHVVAKKTGKNRAVKGGSYAGLVSSGEAEDPDVDLEANKAEDEPVGKRKRRANTKYAADFWRHTNDKGEDLDLPVQN
ncbi:hypothetical protein K438DRAFT_1862950 [Mycena galopus ATCC 62051]|nr:hypothetical protein K438DRAFT_1862950 [Mycena galopus ATCC 62051]